MKKAALLIILLCCVFSVIAAEQPVMRIGVVTDTHVTEKTGTLIPLRAAYKLFRDNKVDLIINAGDIADVYNVNAYKLYRKTVNEVYDGTKMPQEIFAYANHDRIRRGKESVWEVFKDVKKHLGIPNEPHDFVVVKGYPFVVVPQYADFGIYKKLLERAVREFPGKPVFVVDHIPPSKTIYKSRMRADARYDLLCKFPQAVVFCGHIHNTLLNERAIWQGAFTAVNAGCLQVWRPMLIGTQTVPIRSDMALVVELYKDKAVLRRFDVMKQTEVKKTTPWTIPFPHDPNNAPYSIARRKKESSAPEFAAGSKISVSVGKEQVSVAFPRTVHPDGALFYKVELCCMDNGKWSRTSFQNAVGDFMLSKEERSINALFTFSIGYFDAGRKYRVTIVPVHFFGKEGKPLSAEFTVDKVPAGTVVFESRDPMKEMPFKSGLSGGSQFKISDDGFYIHNRHEGRLIFPDETWKAPPKTRFRVTADIHMKQSKGRWTMVMRNPSPLRNVTDRLYTCTGDSGVQRYVFEFTKSKPEHKYYLLIREGGVGKIKFNYIKVERIGTK